MPARLFQIAWSPQTLGGLDPSLEVLDNLAFCAPETVPHTPRLLAMDALESAWRASGHAAYLRAWETMFAALAREAGCSARP